MTKYLTILLLSLTLISCKVDHSGIYHQKNINTTNHTIKLIIHKIHNVDTFIILPYSLYTEDILGGDLFTFLPFKNADSAFIYIDSVFCNVYYNCFLLLNDSTAFHNCMSDSFNLLKPDLYKREKIKDYDYNCSFTIDEKFCTHCK